jgi:pilus assembly protein Flp/PilA
MRRIFTTMLQDESGAVAIEYALIAGLISVFILGAVTVIGTDLNSVFVGIASALQGA